jgi:NAD(P)-dependent dehydrogenase (short-subunit alcohol dehydrogenase family)
MGARRLPELELLAETIAAAGGDAAVLPTDVTRRADLVALVALACERFGRLDVLISNAGIGPISRFEDGLDIPCRKVGANDELFRDHTQGAAKGTRMPRYWMLDERTRLAGWLFTRAVILA